MTIRRSIACGSGSYLPERVLTNDDLAAMVDTSDEWIRSRTGIAKRHIAAKDEKTSDLALRAAERALAAAGMSGADLDLIVVATATPDQTFPSTATRVQAALGMHRGAAFDVQAVCSGFIFALATADNAIRLGQAETALVIGAETFSRILDWTDRDTCVLFGDGAGALVLKAGAGAGGKADRGLLATKLRSDGRHNELLYVDGGPSTTGTAGCLRMRGREVFRHAVENLGSIAEETLALAGATGADVDWIVPHQANYRIIESTARRTNVPMERVILTVSEHGNTSAASIPLALDAGVRDGRVKPGQLVLMEAMGGGFAWGGALLRM